MFRFLSIAAALVVSLSAVQGAVAQMVRTGPFGGVEVRLPRLGVYVDVLPFGQGTRVRAPLTSVNTGGSQYGYGYRPAP